MLTLKPALCCIALALPMALTACQASGTKPTAASSHSTGAPTSASATPDARQRLSASIEALATGNFTYTGKSPFGSYRGEVDKASRTASFVERQDVLDPENATEWETRVFGDSAMISLSSPSKETESFLNIGRGKWYSFDQATYSKISDGSRIFFDSAERLDPGDTVAAVKSAVTVQAGENGTIVGTTDLSGLKNGLINSRYLAEVGEAAKSVSFTATLDSAGRLTAMRTTLPATSTNVAQVTEITYGGFGTVKPQQRPSDVKPAPEALIQWLTLDASK